MINRPRRVDSLYSSYAESTASLVSSHPLSHVSPSSPSAHFRQRSLPDSERAPSAYQDGPLPSSPSPWAQTRPDSVSDFDVDDPYASAGQSFVSNSGGTRRREYGAVGVAAQGRLVDEGVMEEMDDHLHDPGPLAPRKGYARYVSDPKGFNKSGWSALGFANLLTLFVLCMGIVAVFAAYPIISHYNDHNYVNTTSYIGPAVPVVPVTPPPAATPPLGTGGLLNDNAPNISSRALIDPQTPTSVYTKTGVNGDAMTLVFSDEFNVAGRTFYMGEDPFWEAVDLHYWQTGDMEWYDPGSVTTKDGYLEFELTKESLADSHNLGYLGGMLQGWNKLCFTGGRVEMSVSLPGIPSITSFWPAGWLMANIGRVGYGATLDGAWPYSYDSCDIGTLINQTDPKTGGPTAAIASGTTGDNNALSYLPGQRLSRCTCPGENHPGPVFANGTFPGRSATEIDVFEGSYGSTTGQVSQSAQWGPFNPSYEAVAAGLKYFTTAYKSAANTYLGGVFQMATSGLSNTDPTTFDSTTNFGVYGIEYTPTYPGGPGTGKITWLQDNLAMWQFTDTALPPNKVALIGQRLVTAEPMYMVMNLGLSQGFQTFDVTKITLPAYMRVDYVRVYQKSGEINIGCDPPLYPTADYIAKNAVAYHNANLTTYAQFMENIGSDTLTFPKNRLKDTC